MTSSLSKTLAYITNDCYLTYYDLSFVFGARAFSSNPEVYPHGRLFDIMNIKSTSLYLAVSDSIYHLSTEHSSVGGLLSESFK